MPAGELVRVTRAADGTLIVGRTNPGRGAWVHAGPSCVATAARRRAFERALRGPVEVGSVAALVGRLGALPGPGSGVGSDEAVMCEDRGPDGVTHRGPREGH